MIRLKFKRLAMNIICVLLTASLILLTCACHIKKKPPATAEEVLSAMLATIDHPPGKLRTLTAEKETDKLPLELLTALYGSAAEKWYQPGKHSLVDDGAVYLSEIVHPFELAVFRCIDERDVSGGMASVLSVCSARLNMIKNNWQGSVYESYVRDAIVTYFDGYVLLVVAEDPENLIKTAINVIRST